MRAIIIYTITIFIVLACIFTACGQPQSAKRIKKEERRNAEAKLVNQEVMEFLVKAADTRLLSGREGRLASENAVSIELVEYGNRMVNDQKIILGELRKLARQLNVTLPDYNSEEKEKAYEALKETDGWEFDNKFTRMIKTEHERDIKIFRRAMEFDNKQVSDFAKKYLPVIQSHLDEINSIHQKNKELSLVW